MYSSGNGLIHSPHRCSPGCLIEIRTVVLPGGRLACYIMNYATRLSYDTPRATTHPWTTPHPWVTPHPWIPHTSELRHTPELCQIPELRHTSELRLTPELRHTSEIRHTWDPFAQLILPRSSPGLHFLTNISINEVPALQKAVSVIINNLALILIFSKPNSFK